MTAVKKTTGTTKKTTDTTKKAAVTTKKTTDTAKKAVVTTKKTTGTTKKTTDLKTADSAVEPARLSVAPYHGCYVTGFEGAYTYHYISEGFELLSDYVFFGSYEEVCSFIGIPFHPFSFASFSENTRAEFEERHDRIGESLLCIDNSALRVAFDLYWVNAKKAYVIKCFQTIVDYAKFYFGYEKTSCYSLISVVDRFASRDADGNILEEIDPAYSAYSSSKLSLMVNLTDDQISQSIKPAMSVRDIKKVVKSLEDKSLPGSSGEKDAGEGSKSKGGKEGGEGSGSDGGKNGAQVSVVNTIISYKGSKEYGKKYDSGEVEALILRVLKEHPDAVIDISYTLP